MASAAGLRSRQQISGPEEGQGALSGDINAGEGGSNGVTPGTSEEDGHGDIGSHTDESAGTMLDPRELATFRAYQAHAEEFAAYQANQALPRRRQASLSYETQGMPKRQTPNLKAKDPAPYKGVSPAELDEFIYECERQFASRGFQSEEIQEGVTPMSQSQLREETIKKVAYATGFLESTPRTDWRSWLLQNPGGATSWTHFKTLLSEFLEGDKEEAYLEANEKLLAAKQRKGDTINAFHEYAYKLHIRLRALDSAQAMTDRQFFNFIRARILPDHRVELDKLMIGPRTIQELLTQIRKYERAAKTHIKQDGGSRSHSELSSKSQDSKRDNKSGRTGKPDQKGRGETLGQAKTSRKKENESTFVMYKDKLTDEVRERRSKDKACYKCGMPGHRTAECTVKEQVMFDSPKMLEATKN